MILLIEIRASVRSLLDLQQDNMENQPGFFHEVFSAIVFLILSCLAIVFIKVYDVPEKQAQFRYTPSLLSATNSATIVK
jgi:hypothetical protein